MTTTTAARTDENIRTDVEQELHWVSGIDADSIGVGVTDGIVTLSGHVPHLYMRHSAGTAALRIRGVTGLANELEVQFPAGAPTDVDIADAIVHQLRWAATLPSGAITPEVHQGLVTLRGEVQWDSERRAIERQVRRVTGVKWINNEIALTVRASAAETKDRINAALKRNAIIDAAYIDVNASGTEITLTGTVKSWDEKHQAEMTAWASPHVTKVSNHLVVTPR